MIFGDILKELRTDACLTQEDLALKLNITRAVLSKYELGINEPSLEFLSLVSDFFNVSIDYLLGKTRISTPVYNLQQFEKCSPDTYKKLNNILLKLSDNNKYIDFIYSTLAAVEKLI